MAYGGTQLSGPRLKTNPATGELEYSDGDMQEVSPDSEHSTWKDQLKFAMKPLDPRSSLLPYLLPYVAAISGPASGTSLAVGSGASSNASLAGAGIPSLSAPVGSQLLPPGLAAATSVGGSAGASAGVGAGLKGAASTGGGLSMKKILGLTGVQAGLDLLGGALGGNEGARESFEGTEVDPVKIQSQNRQLGLKGLQAFAGRSKGPVQVSRPSVNVPGIPFGIGGGGQSPLQNADMTDLLAYLKSLGGK